MPLERLLVCALWAFCFVALVIEPLYYFGCNWDDTGSSCDSSPHLLVRWVAVVWRIYCRWDPLFTAVPLWLRIMCSIEVFLFGPLYGVCAYGLQYRRPWLAAAALPFSGALLYSTLVYFAMEFAQPEPGTNLTAVLLVNIPWSVVPVLLMYHVWVTMPTATLTPTRIVKRSTE